MYQELADMACNKITAGITRAFIGERPIKALLDSFNPVGSSAHVRFPTSKTLRWETDARRCHVNWVVLDSDWEGELCRVVESHPRVRAYVKNDHLGFEVPYRFGSETRNYLPDFIVDVDDGRGDNDPLHLVVEIKGYRREDAKEKRATMDTYWVPGVNHLGTFGRWAFAELTDVYLIGSDFEAKVAGAFHDMVATVVAPILPSISERITRARDYVVRQLGPNPIWPRINNGIWSVIRPSTFLTSNRSQRVRRHSRTRSFRY
jgi:type III restriction enzyme